MLRLVPLVIKPNLTFRLRWGARIPTAGPFITSESASHEGEPKLRIHAGSSWSQVVTRERRKKTRCVIAVRLTAQLGRRHSALGKQPILRCESQHDGHRSRSQLTEQFGSRRSAWAKP